MQKPIKFRIVASNVLLFLLTWSQWHLTDSSSYSSSGRVGIVFSGRQSPGGHNVIWGLHDAIKTHNPDSVLIGFVGKNSSLRK